MMDRNPAPLGWKDRAAGGQGRQTQLVGFSLAGIVAIIVRLLFLGT
jgi:hypothetical protein